MSFLIIYTVPLTHTSTNTFLMTDTYIILDQLMSAAENIYHTRNIIIKTGQ